MNDKKQTIRYFGSDGILYDHDGASARPVGTRAFHICRPCREGRHVACQSPAAFGGSERCWCDTCDSIRADALADLIDQDRDRDGEGDE